MVSCEVMQERAGYEIDLKESTRRAVKYRRGGDIVIVTHAGRGWFNPLGEEKGDIFCLAMFLDNTPFPSAVEAVKSLVGYRLSRPEWRSSRSPEPIKGISARWRSRHVPFPRSAAWRYLCRARLIPTTIVWQAIREGVLREGPLGSMWAAHLDSAYRVIGWEERGPVWRGFYSGGSKALFRLGPTDASRLCVTEAAIDAMSLAALEGPREQTLYLSTGGGWSPATDAALAAMAARSGLTVVAATDANFQGDIYAARLRAIAQGVGGDWHRLRPSACDWNEIHQKRGKQNRERKMEGKARRAACAPVASREASPGIRRPLTRPATRPARPEVS